MKDQIAILLSTRQDQWPRDDKGGIAMFTRALDLEDLLAQADTSRPR